MTKASRWRHLGQIPNEQTPRGRAVRRVILLAPVVLPMFTVFVLVLRGCATADLPKLHAPKGSDTASEVTTTTTTDLTKISLPQVEGTTTTVPSVQSGRARIEGSVTAPQGPLPGATVRIERIVAGGQITDVGTDADGHFELANIAGGRYRVRAFLPPKLAQDTAQVFFLTDGDSFHLNLSVQSFDGVGTASAIAPDPPLQNQPFSLAVRVVNRTVDGDGLVHAQPIAGATVTVTSPGAAGLVSPPSVTTDATGTASFTLLCKSLTATQVTLLVRANATDPGTTTSVDVAACTPPPTTTTTVPGTGSTTTSSSSSSSGPDSTPTTHGNN